MDFLKNHRLFMVLFLCATLSACGKKLDSGSDDIGSGGSGSGTTTTPTSGTGGGGTVDNTAFRFSISSLGDPAVVTYAHQFGSLTKGCEIAPTATTPIDLKCMVDVREQDLFFYGIKYNINVPKGLCYYLKEVPYAYFNHEPGYGPVFTKAVINSDSGTVTSCNIITPNGASIAGVSAGSSCSVDGTGTFNSDGSFNCVYDHSKESPAGPNCCQGFYSSSITTVASGSSTTNSTSNNDWGGAVGNCTDGPWQKTGWAKSRDGFPTNLYYSVATLGFNEDLTLPSILKTKDPSGFGFGNSAYSRGANLAIYIANMYNWSLYNTTSTTQTAWDLGYVHSASHPFASAPLHDRSGTTLPTLNDSFEYQCLDRAGEIKHRIRVYVNKWNTDKEFEKYLSGIAAYNATPPLTASGAANVAAANPREKGSATYAIDAVEGVDCELQALQTSTGYCDDFWNWDDMADNYIEMHAADTTPNNRFDKFPRSYDK